MKIIPKKILYVCELNNFFPIKQMFIIYPETLSEDNLELFLKLYLTFLILENKI